jgi:hypothetical protein
MIEKESRFLRVQDLQGEIVATISSVTLEPLPGRDGWVMRFNDLSKVLPLNATMLRALERAFGPESDAWTGKRVIIFIDPAVTYNGHVVGGVRSRAAEENAAPDEF